MKSKDPKSIRSSSDHTRRRLEGPGIRTRSAPRAPATRLRPLAAGLRQLIGGLFLASMLLVVAVETTAQETSSGLLLDGAAAEKPVVRLQTAWSVDRARPGDELALAVIFDIRPGYHVNSDAHQQPQIPGFQPVPTQVNVLETFGALTVQSPRYPPAHSLEVDFSNSPIKVFEGRTIIYLPLRVETGFPGDAVGLTLEVVYQACDVRTCLLPKRETLQRQLPMAAPGDTVSALHPEWFAGFGTAAAESESVAFDLFGWHFTLQLASGWGLVLLLLTAALGGFLLNFTPCVLPLIPIKIISLSEASQEGPRCMALGGSMALGVLGFWLLLGAAIALVSGFTATNQLFQYPFFTITVGLIIAVMAVGMCGLFSVRLPGILYRFNPRQDTLTGSFGLGILTAILSTPCTAPFMGAAAAWAATRHPATTLVTFAAIGFGMAIPYLVLSACPGFIQRLPRTGPVSALIKQVMGLFMLAAAAYFIGSGISALTAGPQNPPGREFWWVVMGFVAAGGFWLIWRTWQITNRKPVRVLFGGLGILMLLGSLFGAVRLTDPGPIDWKYYTPERFQEAREEGRTIVLVFTAEWCLNCKALEQSVFRNPTLLSRLAQRDIVPMKVDITGRNPAGKAKLRQLGHLTIPLLVIYGPDRSEVFRSDFYTAEQILAVLNAL